MANTYTSLHFHIIFSTKNRERWITTEIEQRIWEYLGGIARKNQMKAPASRRHRGSRARGCRHAADRGGQRGDPAPKRWLVQMDTRYISNHGRVRLARRLRGLHGEQIAIARCDSLRGQSTRAPSSSDIRGRIQGIIGKARNRI